MHISTKWKPQIRGNLQPKWNEGRCRCEDIHRLCVCNAGQKYDVKWPGGGVTISSTHFKDVVVWNPQDNGRNISDMEDDGWYVEIRSSY